MSDHARAIDLIERAFDFEPYCPACGASTRVRDEDGRLYVECTAAADAHGVIARISAAVLPHVDRLIVDLNEALAA